MEDILQQVRESAEKQILFLPHALRQMSRLDRMITTQEVRETVMTGELIEDYPEDVRGHSCLLFKSVETDRIIHVVCAPKPEYLAIITAYIPSISQWTNNFRERL
ncbi:MAG: hypothetical protein AUK48_03120 [Oscillatoriales cyanobacterium CG2_30_44_21]|nr:MAG: hypothetical protein AUK48_03120 [Oscillatoriales cyanobacterium CG2_30_44_21]